MSEPSAVVLDDFAQQVVSKTAALIDERNKKATDLAAIQGDEDALVASVVENSDNAEVVASRERLEKLKAAQETEIAKLKALTTPLVEEFKAKMAEKLLPLTAEVDEFDKQIRAAVNFLKVTYGEDSTKGLPAMTGRKGRSPSGGAGGTRRVRGFDVYVNGTLATLRNSQGVESSNLAAAAKVIGCPTPKVQEAFFEAQGTKDKDAYKDQVNFTIEHDGASFAVVASRAHADSEAMIKAEADAE